MKRIKSLITFLMLVGSLAFLSISDYSTNQLKATEETPCINCYDDGIAWTYRSTASGYYKCWTNLYGCHTQYSCGSN